MSHATDDPTEVVDPHLRLQLRRRLQLLMTAIFVAAALVSHVVGGASWPATLLGLAAVEVVAIVSPPLLLSQALDRAKPPKG